MRRENKSYSNFSQEAVNKHFNSGGFDNYSSFGELFMFYFDKLDRAGGNRTASMNSVVTEFNSVIEAVFGEYEIAANWDEAQGHPTPTIIKRGIEVPINGLSCGESELFSLVLNLYTLRDQFDIFLIDEPETHLNWHLEKLLFQYLLRFSVDYGKQLIIATHSRVVVDPDFRDSVQFLFWKDGSIAVTDRLPKEQREKLVEDAYDALRVGGESKFTVFCEDDSHKAYFDELASMLNIENFFVSRCGTSPNVKSLYRRSMDEGGWDNCIFVVDGDGQGMWKHAGDGFYQLKKYCIENYAFNIASSSYIFNKSEDDIKSAIAEFLKTKKEKLFGKSKSLEFLVDLLKPSDITQDRIDQIDGSEIMPSFLTWLGYTSQRDLWKSIFDKCVGNMNSANLDDFVDSNILVKLREWANKSVFQTAGASAD